MKKGMESASCIASDFIQVAEVELVYKTKIKASERPVVRSGKDGYDVLKKS